jgi:hypothetical protein
MKTMILAAAAVIALGVGTVGTAFAEGEGGSATGAIQWQSQNGTVAATQFFSENPTAPAAQQYAYVQAPFRDSQDNGQG